MRRIAILDVGEAKLALELDRRDGVLGKRVELVACDRCVEGVDRGVL